MTALIGCVEWAITSRLLLPRGVSRCISVIEERYGNLVAGIGSGFARDLPD